MKVLNEINEILLSNGASLVGFANIKNYDLKINKKFKSGISIAVALDPQIVKDITEGPTLAYYDEYKKVNKKLDFLSDMISSLINDRGYNAENWGATDDRIYGHLMTELPHKTMATLSGLGWIGKCALLITKEFGAAIRLTTVLTDIDEQIKDNSIKKSKCNNCRICVDICPGKAPKGVNWYRGLARDSFFDPDACRKSARKLAKERTGILYTFCGICIANCPYTKEYVNKKIGKPEY